MYKNRMQNGKMQRKNAIALKQQNLSVQNYFMLRFFEHNEKWMEKPKTKN